MEYLDEIIKALGDEKRFIRLTFSGAAQAAGAPCERITVRPVLIGGEHKLQAVLKSERKETAVNFASLEAAEKVNEFLEMGFRHIDLQCTDGDLHVRLTKKGKALASRGKPSATASQGDLAHDREKAHPFPESEPNEFLEALGIMRNGHVLGAMRDKFRQINHFLELLGHTDLVRMGAGQDIHIVDCGCGRAFLTFAAYHYLRKVVGLPVRLTGVDANDEVILRATELRAKLKYDEIALVKARILDFEPARPVHAVLSLHACDTATDEAIAQGVKWGADLILCVPCCQHELHHAIVRPEFRAALRHGILRERMADIVTDALRAAALRVMGYQTEVIEFISPGETAKNLMIRAEKAAGGRKAEAAAEYVRLRDFWNVTPSVEKLLGATFRDALGDPASLTLFRACR